MLPRKLILPLALIASLTAALHAQEAERTPLPSGPTGTVVGSVTFAESRLPARFVPIVLVPQPSDADPIPRQDAAFHIHLVRGVTGIEGSFHLDRVPIGDYYIAALLPGATNAAMLSVLTATDAQVKSMLSAYTSVSVAAGSTSSLRISLHVGATISGRVQYADGAPVIVGPVSFGSVDSVLAHPELSHKITSPRQAALQLLLSAESDPRLDPHTDDTGHFRIYGIPPGKYTLSTMLMVDHLTAANVSYSNGRSSNENRGYIPGELIPIYAPSSFARKDARIFELHGDEQITDADITIDPQGLHILRGKVLIGANHMPPPGGAFLMLREEGSKETGRFVSLEEDGSFQFTWLPAGAYSLLIAPGIDSRPSSNLPKEGQPVRYKTVHLPAILDDHDVTLDDVLLVAAGPDDPPEEPFLF